MKPVRFLEEALDEFLDQVKFYEDRQKGLGERFRLSVQAATTLAATHPKLGSPWRLRTRRVFPKGFKFAVVCTAWRRKKLWSLPWLTSAADPATGGVESDVR